MKIFPRFLLTKKRFLNFFRKSQNLHGIDKKWLFVRIWGLKKFENFASVLLSKNSIFVGSVLFYRNHQWHNITSVLRQIINFICCLTHCFIALLSYRSLLNIEDVSNKQTVSRRRSRTIWQEWTTSPHSFMTTHNRSQIDATTIPVHENLERYEVIRQIRIELY